MSPGADAPRLVAEVRDNLDLLSQKVESLTKTVERMGKKVDSCENTSKAAEEGVRALQAPIQEATSGLASIRQVGAGGGPGRRGGAGRVWAGVAGVW